MKLFLKYRNLICNKKKLDPEYSGPRYLISDFKICKYFKFVVWLYNYQIENNLYSIFEVNKNYLQ